VVTLFGRLFGRGEPPSGMDEARFWAIVDGVHTHSPDDMEAKSEALKEIIAKLPPKDAIKFSEIFDATMNLAYAWPLWGAAYVINGGCGDDTFMDFRSALISRGRAAFERAMADPDSLADEDIDEEAFFFEGYQYAVSEGVEASAGRVVMKSSTPSDPSGEAWNEETVAERYPRLRAKYGG
jgi:hypothetical protein